MSDLKQNILSLIENDLIDIEQALENNLKPNLKLVKKIAGHLIFAGGKRLRPLLMIHAARMCGSKCSENIKHAVLFEYLHAATLLHDDLVDEAELRRGKPVAHILWDNASVILTGDFLLARAVTLAAETDSIEIVRLMSRITEEMSQGEISQLENKGKHDLTEEEYLEVIKRKTAVLIMGACKTGGFISHATENQLKQLETYGYNLGITFQMADDLLDYNANTRETGKKTGTDLREGKLTLPVIIALRNAKKGDRENIISFLGKQDITDREFSWFNNTLAKYNGFKYTTESAEHHARKAKEALADFGDSPSKRLLLMLSDYALKRKA